MERERVLKAVAQWIDRMEKYKLYGSMLLKTQGGPVESIGFQINYRQSKGGDTTDIEFIIDNTLPDKLAD